MHDSDGKPWYFAVDRRTLCPRIARPCALTWPKEKHELVLSARSLAWERMTECSREGEADPAQVLSQKTVVYQTMYANL